MIYILLLADLLFLAIYAILNMYILHHVFEMKIIGDKSELGISIYIASIGWIIVTSTILYVTLGIGG